MTTAARAQAAADFLNAGERWQVWLFGQQWLFRHLLDSHGGLVATRDEIIDLALKEGWQPNDPQNVPIAGAETGQPGKGR